MREFIKNEMLIHTALCTSKEPKNVLIISNNATALENEVKKHDNINFSSITCSIDALSTLKDNFYDVIVSQMILDKSILAQIQRVLKSDALLVSDNFKLDDIESNKELLSMLGKYFKIIMPFYVGGDNTALLCSKEYHPTADVILQRADMLDNLEFYNSDVHKAVFAMGRYIKKAYLGYFKN